MILIEDWGRIAKKAWSMRFAVLSALCAAAEVALPFFTDFVPPKTMAVLAAITACASAVSRIVAQPEMHK